MGRSIEPLFIRCPHCGYSVRIIRYCQAKVHAPVGVMAHTPGVDWEGGNIQPVPEYDDFYYCDHCGEKLFNSWDELVTWFKEHPEKEERDES